MMFDIILEIKKKIFLKKPELEVKLKSSPKILFLALIQTIKLIIQKDNN